jgi:ferric-dicitrate binding protein FerR (iron transport regulator)
MMNCDGLRRLFEKCSQYFRRLWRFPRHIYELFLIAFRANKLVHEFLSEQAAKRGPSNVTKVDFWAGSSHRAAEIRRRWQAVGLVLTATAAVTVSIGYLIVFHTNADSAGTKFETAANELRTEKLADGTGMTLGAQSNVRVEFTAERRVVQHLGGEIEFDVAEDTRPFVVSTFLVDLSEGTKFAVLVDTTVIVMVHEGVVRVSGRGAKPGSPGIIVKGGEIYRVPVDGFRTVVADGGVDVARVQGSSS